MWSAVWLNPRGLPDAHDLFHQALLNSLRQDEETSSEVNGRAHTNTRAGTDSVLMLVCQLSSLLRVTFATGIPKCQ